MHPFVRAFLRKLITSSHFSSAIFARLNFSSCNLFDFGRSSEQNLALSGREFLIFSKIEFLVFFFLINDYLYFYSIVMFNFRHSLAHKT